MNRFWFTLVLVGLLLGGACSPLKAQSMDDPTDEAEVGTSESGQSTTYFTPAAIEESLQQSRQSVDTFSKEAAAVGAGKKRLVQDERSEGFVQRNLKLLAEQNGKKNSSAQLKTAIAVASLKLKLANPPYCLLALDAEDEVARSIAQNDLTKASTWNLEQLEILKETLDALPAELRASTNSIMRFQAREDLFGFVADVLPDNVILYDLAAKQGKTPNERKKFFQKVLIHEMIHTFQNGSGKDLLEKFKAKFWLTVANATNEWSRSYYKMEEKTTVAAGIYPRGVSTSAYGTGLVYPRPQEWAHEDMAESGAMKVLFPGYFRNHFPVRDQFLTQAFAAMNPGCGVVITEEIDPKSLDFLSYDLMGEKVLIRNEHFPLNFYPYGDDAFDWVNLQNPYPKNMVATQTLKVFTPHFETDFAGERNDPTYEN
jgi:hypothetical protein